LIDDDSRISFELTLFATNIKKEVYGVMEHSFFFKKDLKKTFQKMLHLILDLRFKSLCSISSFLGYEKRVSIVE